MTPDSDAGREAAGNGATLTIRRTFDAPRDRVYRAFVEPDELGEWFVPAGMEATVHAVEPEPGGRFAVSWTDGEHTMENEGTFVEVVEHERLVTVEEIDDGELRLVYEFSDADDGGTELVMTQTFPDAVPEGADGGWNAILDQLETVVERP